MAEKKFSLALVTGANSGIGEAICHLLAQKKIPLIISGRDLPRLEKVATALRSYVPIDIFPADLTKHESRWELIRKMQETCPDLVINNAGFGKYGIAIDIPTHDQAEMLDVNCKAVTELSIEAAKLWRSQQKTGIVLNVSSTAGFIDVFPQFTVYAASKAYVNHFSQSLDMEMEKYGIRILASCPGMVRTRFQEHASNQKTSGTKRKMMTAEFAAQEIWKQIQKQSPVHIFNGFYRLGIMIKHLIPKRWIGKMLSKNIESRL